MVQNLRRASSSCVCVLHDGLLSWHRLIRTGGGRRHLVIMGYHGGYVHLARPIPQCSSSTATTTTVQLLPEEGSQLGAHASALACYLALGLRTISNNNDNNNSNNNIVIIINAC